jgi:hypothetical protein
MIEPEERQANRDRTTTKQIKPIQETQWNKKGFNNAVSPLRPRKMKRTRF